MKNRPRCLALVLSMLVCLGVATAVVAEPDPADAIMGNGQGACSQHAELMLGACFADKRDDYLVHLADCSYTVSAEDQRDCKNAAKYERRETADECEEIYETRLDICDLVGEGRYVPEFDSEDFVDPDDIGDTVAPNPYWPLNAGRTQVIVAEDEVGVVTVTEEVRYVGGLPCRVLRDVVFEVEEDEGEIEYETVEATDDWYAQMESGDVVYCGESTYEVEDGLIDNTDGSFAHGSERALAGVLVRAFPVPGEGDRQEMATDEAEDFVLTLSLAASPSEDEGGDVGAFPCAGACLQTWEVNPYDPGEAEKKYYRADVGFVLATKYEDGEASGEREEVTCIGDSLDVLEDPACGIADPEALREAFCERSPGVCEEEDDE